MWKYLTGAIALSAVLTAPSWAITAAQVGIQIQVDYVEPTTSIDENGQAVPLDDLDKTVITVLDQGVELVTEERGATKVDGGGAISHLMNVNVLQGQKKTFTIEVTAVDTSGNVSLPATTTLLIDKQPPAPPQ